MNNADIHEEVLLNFQYAGDNQYENAKKLCEVLKENNIDFCAFIKNNGYRPEFFVRRCGRKWNDIMHIINEVQAPFYRKKKETFKIVEKLEIGVGNLQKICIINL